MSNVKAQMSNEIQMLKWQNVFEIKSFDISHLFVIWILKFGFPEQSEDLCTTTS